MTEKYYIRFGKIPKDENSKEYKHRKEIDTVLGVSCFDCFIDSNNIPHVIVPNPINIECVEDLYWFLKYSKEPIYLITGDKVGMGTDNEPLLKNIKIIKEIYLH